MSVEITVALISLAGSALGTLGGIVASSKLTAYRISQLEKKVEKHNTVIDRTYKCENDIKLLDERQKVANHRIDDLERLTEHN